MSLKDNFLYINHKKSYMNRDKKKHIQRKDTRTNKDFFYQKQFKPGLEEIKNKAYNMRSCFWEFLFHPVPTSSKPQRKTHSRH